MSALLIEDLSTTIPVSLPGTGAEPRRWRHVERGPQARPHLVSLPGGRPGGVAAPAAARVPARVAASTPARTWELTDQGIAVVVVFFLAVVALAAVVLVSGFLAVSDAPLPVAPPVVAAAAQG